MGCSCLNTSRHAVDNFICHISHVLCAHISQLPCLLFHCLAFHCICMYVCMYVCMCVCVCVCVCVYTCTYIHMIFQTTALPCISLRTYIHTYIRIYVYTYIHMHININIHIHHIHKYINIIHISVNCLALHYSIRRHTAFNTYAAALQRQPTPRNPHINPPRTSKTHSRNAATAGSS